jgi:phage-related protein
MSGEAWNWTFYGFQTPGQNRPVQEWYDSLPDALPSDARNEIKDILAYLQVTPNSQWGKPEFSPLGDGLFEIRYEDADYWYRIYGCYWPDGVRQVFTFLHATTKKVKNDTDGKSLARKRKAQLQRQEATIHKFKF